MTQSRTRILLTSILAIIAIAGVTQAFRQHHRAVKAEAQSASRLDAADAFREDRDNTNRLLKQAYVTLGRYQPEYTFMARDDFVPAGGEYDVAHIAAQIEYYSNPIAVPQDIPWPQAEAKVAALKVAYLRAILNHNDTFGQDGQSDPFTYNTVPPAGLGDVGLKGVTYHLDYANLDGLPGVLINK